MKKVKLALLSLFLISLIACSSTNNPLSSEYDEDQGNGYSDTIQFDTSGGSEHG